MNPNTQEILSSIGLSKHESSAYLALLAMGKGSADSVASRANIKRSTAYLALESLLRQGLVLKVPRARKVIFVAKSPEELERIEAKRLDEVHRLVPLLRAMSSEVAYFSTKLYEGIPGIMQAYQFRMDELRDTEYVGFFGFAPQLDQNLLVFLKEWNQENARRNIKSRAIVPDHPTLKEFRERDAEVLREVKIVPQAQYPSKVSIEIYDDFVRIILFEQQAAVIIESPPLAIALKSVFEMLW